jgi:hypothetical protein
MRETEDATMRETKEWTLMFFFASDNPLAISIVSQLKAIKAAGFHHEANVLVQFDPYTEGTPTHIFDVNVINKLKQKEPNIGFEGEPLVPNLIEDRLWRTERGEDGKAIREEIKEILRDKYKFKYDVPEAPDLNGESETDANNTSSVAQFNIAAQTDHTNGSSNGTDAKGTPHRGRRKRQEPNPLKSLKKFLDFCRTQYPARHYMLFILGHGVVVGNDIFLYDEHADTHSITLNDMGATLREFKEKIEEKASFDLVSFHSCSVSSLEVAYELYDTANYFLASQGPMFVGSWPYREILMRIFKDLKPNPTDKEIRHTIGEIFSYCLQNSADYLLAGYSYQLTLCDLRKLPDLSDALQEFSNALVDGLEDAASTFIILYSHWKAQSFFQEMYTDVYDFCYCIDDRCKRIQAAQDRPNEPLREPLQTIWNTSKQLMQKLEKPTGPTDTRNETSFVLASEFAGPSYQYSRGLSVYFPWSRPSEDSEIMEQYETYTFHTAFHSEPTQRKSWKDFLDKYFTATQRVPKGTELLWELSNNERISKFTPEPKVTLELREQKLKEDIASLVYSGEGPLGGSLAKDDPRDRIGGTECGCPSFKNYPRDTRARKIRRRQATKMPVSKSLLGEFKITLA